MSGAAGGDPVRRRPAHVVHPDDVHVQQSTQLAAYMRAEAVRRVRVAGPVGERVVASVGGDPADDVALETHRRKLIDPATASAMRTGWTAR